MEVDDPSLVEAAKAGDAGAFKALVVRYQRKVYAVALGIVKDPDLAWDVAQEAFVRVHRHLPEFKGDSAFSTWIYRIASHLAIDAVRKERPRPEGRRRGAPRGGPRRRRRGDPLQRRSGSDPSRQPAAAGAGRPDGGGARRAAGDPPEILVLREVEGLSYEELAARLGIQKGTVMSRLFHARKKMQAALADYAGLRVERDRGGEA